MDHDFRQFSPREFELLVRDLLQAEYGERFETFKPGRDGGIDLRLTNKKGAMIVQCKHYRKSGFPKLLAQLKNQEHSKIKNLNPDRYILATSVGLTPPNKDLILSALHPYIKNTADILGADDINNLINKNPEIEKQHLKLWLNSSNILSRIIDNDIHVQTDFHIERIKKNLKLYVENPSLPEARKKLEENRFLIIAGEPGIGKTTLANILLYSYVKLGYEPVVIITDPAEARRRYLPSKPIIFYYDDFLGQTFLHDRLLPQQDKSIVEIIELVKHSNNARLIITTRDFILTQALREYEKLKRSNILDGKYILNLGKYSDIIKAKILYNHLYFSNLEDEFLESVINKKFYITVIRHKNYNPRLIDFITNQRNLKGIIPDKYPEFFLKNLNHPEEIWRDAFERQISNESQFILLSILSLESNASLKQLEFCFNSYYGEQNVPYFESKDSKLTALKDSLRELEGTFIKIDNGYVTFSNPSIKDFLENWILENTNVIQAFLNKALFFKQISCIWDSLTFAKSPSKTHMQAWLKGIDDQKLLNLIESPNVDKIIVDGITRWGRHDSGYCNRIETLFEMHSTLPEEKFLTLISKLVSKIINSENLVDDNVASLVALYQNLKEFKQDNFQEHLLELKQKIVIEVSDRQSLDSFNSIEEIYHSEDFEKEDREVLADKFIDYCNKGAVEECASLPSEEIEIFIQKIDSLSRLYDIDIGNLRIELKDIYKDAIREEENYESSKPDWDDDGDSRFNDNSSIDDLFSTLIEE